MRLFVTVLALAACLTLTDAAVGIYDIGNIRPEGIHVLPDGAAELMGLGEGDFAIVSELFYGGIKAVNLNTGEVTQIVDSVGFRERSTVGLWYDDGVILAAGGGPNTLSEESAAVVHVFDAVTGEILINCVPDGGGVFFNDVTVIDGTAYATDSFQNRIMTLDVESAKNGVCVLSSIETPAEVFLSDDEFSANGECLKREAIVM